MTAEKSSIWEPWEPHRWMGDLTRKDLSLASLTIPGTHNTCATHGGIGDAARCQTLSVREQLDHGIRFFDIRCVIEGSGSSRYFEIFHGPVNQQIPFGRVLIGIDEFLKANPTEVVLMRIRKEHDGDSRSLFNSTFWEIYLKNDGWERLFHISGSIPKVSEAAGKIVPFSGDIDGLMSMGVFDWQDDYRADLSDKKKLVRNHLMKAGNAQNGAFVNSLNIQFNSMHDPQHWAGRVNPSIRDYIRYDLWVNWHWETYLPRLGIIAMDFPENTGWVEGGGQGRDTGLVPLIINWNFARKGPPKEYMPKPEVTKCHIAAVDEKYILEVKIEGVADAVVNQVMYYVNDEIGYDHPVDVVGGKWQMNIEFEGEEHKSQKVRVLTFRSRGDEEREGSEVVNAATGYEPVEFTKPAPVVSRRNADPLVVSGTGVKGSTVTISVKHWKSLDTLSETVQVSPENGIWTVEFNKPAWDVGIHNITARVVDNWGNTLLRLMSFNMVL